MGDAASAAPGSIAAALAADEARVAARLLQPACATFFVPPATTVPARGVVLLLHGWSAGPWQYAELARTLAARGLAAYAPRLAGHGSQYVDGRADLRDLPLSRQWLLYREGATAAFTQAAAYAKEHGLPLSIVGFSMGGALALDLLARPGAAVERLLLVAPLLRPRAWLARITFAACRLLLPVGLGRWLDRRPTSWGKVPVTPIEGAVRAGHWDFLVGNLVAALLYAHRVWRAATPLAVPTQLVVSDVDRVNDPVAARRLVARAAAPHHVLRFAPALKVPHAMVSPFENTVPKSCELLHQVAADFLADGRGRDGVVEAL